uniref:Odorant receptor n=1 Tax=Cyrtorhinus lividipennis TaxID=1032904 RepID=A0A346TI20_9HEMI|nr:odorant receptor 12 [Cyrtorhinus lividipennis]
MTGGIKQESENGVEVFSTQFKIMEAVGMWSTGPPTRRKEVITKLKVGVSAFVLGVSTVALLVKAVVTNDLVDRSEAMDICTLTGSACYKLLFFYYYREEFQDFVSWDAALVPHLPPKWTAHMNFFSILHCATGLTCISAWSMCPLFKWAYKEIELKDMTLPMNVYDPFDSQGLLFAFFYLCGVYGLISSTHIYMSCDAFFFSTAHVANGAYETLKTKFKSMGVGNENSLGDPMHDELKACVKLHTHIITFIRKTDALFKSLFFVDVLHAIISLSFSLLQASESKGIFEKLKMITFVTYCFVHQYLNSYFGQRLIDQQESLANTLVAYVPWNEGTLKMKKSFLIVTANAQKTFKLAAWKVYTLQYATFMEFVKTMIQFYMVLRQVQDESQTS